MANLTPASRGAAVSGSPQALWFDNTNMVSPGANESFTWNRSHISNASMDHSHIQNFPPKNGHCRTRSTITIPRSSWVNDLNLPNPGTPQSRILPNSAYANDLSAGHSYCLDRGNGEFTRLIPADLLPALNEVPARETRPHGMVVLPSLGLQNSNRSLTFKKEFVTFRKTQKKLDNLGPIGPLNRKNKIYCDKWVHEGVCAFTQQGCKFKHEMPFDENTQRSLGLFQGFPAWWKKRNEEAVVDAPHHTVTFSPSQLEFCTASQTPAQSLAKTHGHTSQNPIPVGNLHRIDRTGDARSLWMRRGIVPFFKGPI